MDGIGHPILSGSAPAHSSTIGNLNAEPTSPLNHLKTLENRRDHRLPSPRGGGRRWATSRSQKLSLKTCKTCHQRFITKQNIITTWWWTQVGGSRCVAGSPKHDVRPKVLHVQPSFRTRKVLRVARQDCISGFDSGVWAIILTM